MKKLISIVTPCYNEQGNVEALYRKVQEVLLKHPEYNYEHIFIDNCSTDKTVLILKEIAKQDKRLKIIVNSRNFGHIRSPYYALLQAQGDCVILLCADFQDPPELLSQFIKKWESGFKIVIGIKNKSDESKIMYFIRSVFYDTLNMLSEISLIKNYTGFGLYDRIIIEHLREIRDPYPFFRGIICDIGFERCEINYRQPIRKKGKTSNNFYSLYDIAMLGVTSYSKVPIRLMIFSGIILAVISMLISISYLVYKFIYWDSFSLGVAPIVIGLFFFFSVNFIFLGIIGEYVGHIHTQVTRRPLVIENYRINFKEGNEK